MALTIRPLHPTFVAEIAGVDFVRPLEQHTVSEIVAAMDAYSVCVFRRTGLTDSSHVAFSRQLGVLEHAPSLGAKRIPRFDHPELFDAGNLDAQGSLIQDGRRRLYNLGNALWHTDSSFNEHRAAYSLLLAHEIPPAGGDTEFADMYAAYESLPAALQSDIEDLVAEHWLWHSRMLAGYPEPTQAEREAKPPARHKLVQIHPGSRRKSLYIAAHASHIVGRPADEGLALITKLIELATRPQFVYRLKWQDPGDLVIWDNRCTMHRATPFEDTVHRRDMRRTTVYDPVASQPLS
jgi:alpha-ketoglutarate-dependent 2,4-dichlorophenoxyacetate dioxygenase